MLYYDKNDSTLTNIAERFQKRLKARQDVTLQIDETLGEFSGRIKNGVISAGSYPQLLEGCGRFLRNPDIGPCEFTSHKEVCGMYFATHNGNYMDAAPVEEILDYIDNLAFWGMNTFKLWFDMSFYRHMGEGAQKVAGLKAMLQHARSMGIKTILVMLSNEAFKDSVEELRADWTCGHDGYIYPLNDHYHLEICPSKAGGMELIKAYRREMLEAFADAEPDFISLGAYDEGGCTCKACAPWGSNGYIRCCEELIPLIREYFPHTKFIMSLWQFGTFTGTDAEFINLSEILESGRFPEVQYVLSEPQYAKYPFIHGMPRPIIGFPEISMYRAVPWGGYGVNPQPKHLGKLWAENGDKLEGGLPYSEGLYEDINKAIMLRLYRDNQDPVVTVREYLQYEFGLRGSLLEKVHTAILDMEETLERSYDPGHRYVILHPGKIPSIQKAIAEADAALPEEIRQCKKWRLIYLRAMIDAALLENDFYRNDEVLGYFEEIIDLCHLRHAGFHVKPDVLRDEHFGRKLTLDEVKFIAAGGSLDDLEM